MTPANPPFFRSRDAFFLLLITIAGGLLRFFHLGTPSLWLDEGLTFGRITGSYDDLLQLLQYDGFLPLHYELYWLLGRVTFLGPAMMRLVPALAGTLLIPAAYFLARQLVNRRAALLAAAGVACSAYLLYYSRDAKMYMPFWLCLTLQLACLLWWLAAGKRLAWLCWVAAGVAAAGLHAPGLIFLAIQPLFLRLPRGRRCRTAALFLAGTLVIAVGPASYYLLFNKWNQRTGGLAPGTGNLLRLHLEREQEKGWSASGLNWIENYFQHRDGPTMVLHCSSAYLLGYEWPTAAQRAQRDDQGQPLLYRPLLTVGVVIISTLLGLCALGALPWRRRREELLADAGGAGMAAASAPGSSSVKLFRLACLLVLPAYCVFYCRSIQDFASPLTWLEGLYRLQGWRWLLVVPATLGLFGLAGRLPRAPALLATLLGLLAAATLLLSIATGGPRYLFNLLDLLHGQTVGAPLLLLGTPLLLWYAGQSHRQRAKAAWRFFAVAAGLLLLCAAAWAIWKGLWLLALQHDSRVQWHSIWVPRYLGMCAPFLIIAAAALIVRLPWFSLRILAIVLLLGVNLGNALSRILLPTEPPLEQIAADVWAGHGASASSFTLISLPAQEPAMARQSSPEAMLSSPQGRYYLCQAAGFWPPTPAAFRELRLHRAFPLLFYHGNKNGQHIANTLRCKSNVTTVIVWSRADRAAALFPPDPGRVQRREIASTQPAQAEAGRGRRKAAPSPPPADAILAALGNDWRLAESRDYATHLYWVWSPCDTLTRRVFVRKP